MTLADDTPYTENVVIDFETSRMKCMFFEEEWIIEKMLLRNHDKLFFTIFLEKVAPTTVPFTMISSVAAICKPVEQLNYFDKTLSRCKIFSCAESAIKSDRVHYPNRRIHIALYPKDEQAQPGVYVSGKKLLKLDPNKETEISKYQAGIQNLACDLATLFENCRLSDVTLTAGKKSVGAHKCVLVARSEVFQAMFEHGMSESQNNTVEIEDVDPDVLQIFVRFLYTGKFPEVTVDIASNLYIVSDKYAVGELKMKCAEFLCSNLSMQNVLGVLNLADCFSDEMMKQKALNFILDNRDFLVSEQFYSFKDSSPKLACEVYAFYVENVKHSYQLPARPRVVQKQVYHQRLRFPEPINPQLSLMR